MKQKNGLSFFLRLLNNPAFYLGVLAFRMQGKGIQNPNRNGEYRLIESIIKNSVNQLTIVDGGAFRGDYTLKVFQLLEKYNKKARLICIEPFPATLQILKKNLSQVHYELIECGLSNTCTKNFFYYDQISSGVNSLFQHKNLNDGVVEVDVYTLDYLSVEHQLLKIDICKLDIEGAELDALEGCKRLLSNGHISYIQIEYSYTWIKSSATMERLFNLCTLNNYRLYRICQRGLLLVDSYSYALDDFIYSNLLMVHKDAKNPLKILGNALPFHDQNN